MATMTIKHGSFRRNHGGWSTHATTEIDLDTGEVSEFYSRRFHCECGEPMHDGDMVDGAEQDRTGRIIHMNCREELI